MTHVTIQEAQQRLPELLAAVAAGDIVSIQSESGQVFQVAMRTPAPVINPAWPGYPHPGSAQGLIHMREDFDEPLDEMKEYME